MIVAMMTAYMTARSHRLALAFALTAIALAAPACAPVCDEAGLPGVAQALEPHTLEAQHQGLEALSRVCPSLPPALHKNLTVEYSETPLDVRTQVLLDHEGDPTWRQLLERTCPRLDDATQSLQDRERDAAEHDRFIRERCELDRYGLLAPHDRFVRRDLLPMMLYEWLVSGRVESDAAASVVRPLLSAQATPEELEAMCRQRELACADAFETWGLRPPASTIRMPPEAGVELRLDSAALSVGGRPVLALSAGHAAPDAFSFHLSPSLVETLHTRAQHDRARLGVSSEDWNASVTVLADRSTPMGTLADVLFNATKAGFTSFSFVVHQGHRLRGLDARPELAWRQRWVHPHERQHDIVVEIHRDSVEASIRVTQDPPTVAELAGCEGASASCAGLEPLRAFTREVHRLMPNTTTAHLRIDRDAPLQHLATVADVLRGESCPFEETMELDDIEDCVLFDLRIDTVPPLYYAIGRTGTLTLGEATVRKGGMNTRGGPPRRALLAAYAAARDEITRCLVEHPQLLRYLDDEDEIIVAYLPSSDDPRRSLARPDTHVEYQELEQLQRCVVTPLGAEPAPVFPRPDYDEIQVELVIPVRFSPADDDGEPGHEPGHEPGP